MKKGFTLIELLAVIVILAIIALIATPIVLSIIGDSKESASLRSAEMYLDAVEYGIADVIMDNKTITNGTHTIMENGNICIGTYNNKTCTGDIIEVEVKGEVPKEGSTITIEEGKIKDINLLYGDITIIKDENRNLVYSNVEGGNEAGGQKVTITPKKETYTVGDEVTIGEESFYVIADDANKVILLTKDRIDVENLVQSANANNVAFSSTNYWSTETNIEGLDLNKYPIPEGVTSVITTAKEYGAKVGGTGRLIAYEEATTLQTVDSDILYGTNGKSSGSSFNYWMGVAHASDKVKIVLGEEGGMLLYYDFNSPISVGVRPVVEISKANLS